MSRLETVSKEKMKVQGLVLSIPLVFSACTFDGVSDKIQNPTLPPPDTLALQSQKIAGQIRRYQNQITALRGLPFKREVKSAVITREEYRRMTASEIDASLSDSLSRDISIELAQWGFFTDTTWNYKDLFKSFEGGFAAGFYIGGSDSVFVLSEYVENEIHLLHILPHELTHALQDQYGRLRRTRIEDSATAFYQSDVDAFHTALVEGEGAFLESFVTATYAFPQPDPLANTQAVVQEMVANGLAQWQAATRPNNLFLPAWAPYQFGTRLICDAYTAKGWDSVETLFDHPLQPAMTAITGRPQPLMPFDFSEYFRRVDTAGAYTDMGLHGSLGLMSLLNEDLDSARFFSGLGWRGDRYAYARKPGQAFGSLLWAGAFADEGQAARVWGGLSLLLRRRFANSQYPVSVDSNSSLIANLPGIHLQGKELQTYLLKDGVRIYWMEGLSNEACEALAQSLKSKAPSVPALALKGLVKSQYAWISGKGRIYPNKAGNRLSFPRSRR